MNSTRRFKMADETALTTAPVDRPGALVRRAFAAPDPGVAKGVATDYLIELVEYPANSGRGLWLKVNGCWQRLDNPSGEIQASIHAAFCHRERLKVVALYRDKMIVGLVVESRESSQEPVKKEANQGSSGEPKSTVAC